MSTTGLEVFDTTIHKTNVWLYDVMKAMAISDRRHAYLALRATLHALRDRMPVEEVAQFAAQLPMLIRGFYYENWDPTGKPLKLRHEEAFLAAVAMEFPVKDIEPDTAARAVFDVLAKRVSAGEINDVRQLLPAEIRALWTEPASSARGAT